MKKRIVFTLATAIGLAIAATASASTVVVITPDEVAPPGPIVTDAWQEANVRGTGSSIITEFADAHGGGGALRQAFADSLGKTDLRLYHDFGPVSELSALGFDWYRDAGSTAPAHFTPALGITVQDSTGDSWLLKWEGVYNGYPVAGTGAPTDQWVSENVLGANFWRIPQVIDGNFVGISGCNNQPAVYECFVFDRKLTDAWLADFRVVGIEVGIGSGWAGSFVSYVDYVTVGDTTYDFEVEEPPVEVVLTTKDECLDDGWTTSTNPVFKNQGQCVSFFATGGAEG